MIVMEPHDARRTPTTPPDHPYRYNDAARELRESIEHRRAILARTDDLAEATAKAIDAMIAANNAALALWNEREEP